MLIQKQYNKSVLLEIYNEMEIQQFLSLLKKAKETVFRLFKRYRSLLSDTQFSRIRKAFANGSSVNIIFSSTQLSKMVQLGGFVIQYIPVLLMFYWMQLKRGQM